MVSTNLPYGMMLNSWLITPHLFPLIQLHFQIPLGKLAYVFPIVGCFDKMSRIWECA